MHIILGILVVIFLVILGLSFGLIALMIILKILAFIFQYLSLPLAVISLLIVAAELFKTKEERKRDTVNAGIVMIGVFLFTFWFSGVLHNWANGIYNWAYEDKNTNIVTTDTETKDEKNVVSDSNDDKSPDSEKTHLEKARSLVPDNIPDGVIVISKETGFFYKREGNNVFFEDDGEWVLVSEINPDDNDVILEFIPGITSQDIKPNLINKYGMKFSGPRRTNTKYVIDDGEVFFDNKEFFLSCSIYYPGNNKIDWIDFSIGGKDLSFAKEYLGQCATVPYENSQPNDAREWVIDNCMKATKGETIKNTFGGIIYELSGTKNMIFLTIIAPGSTANF